MRREVEQQQALMQRQFDEWQAEKAHREDLKKTDPLKWLDEEGFNYNEATSLYLNGGKLPPELEMQRQLQATQKRLDEMIEKDRLREQQWQEQQNAVMRSKAERDFIQEAVTNHSKYPSLMNYTEKQLVQLGWDAWQNIINQCQELGLAREEWPKYTDGEILEALEEQEKASKAEALGNKIPKPAPTNTEPPKTAPNRPHEEPPPTLGNDATAEVAPGTYRFTSLEERRARFRKQLGIG